MNQRNFTNHKELYLEKAIAVISSSHDIHSQRSILKMLHLHCQTQQHFPVEALIRNIVDNIPLLPSRKTIYNAKFTKINKKIKIDYTPKLPALFDQSLKILFKVLKIDTIVDLFLNLVFERGLFIIGNDRNVGFHVVESLTSLLFPFSWNFAKVTSYPLDYNFFDSPISLIYFVKSNEFRESKLRGRFLENKCILWLESGVLEYDFDDTPGFPKKLRKMVVDRLVKVAGKYNSFYMDYKKKFVQ